MYLWFTETYNSNILFWGLGCFFPHLEPWASQSQPISHKLSFHYIISDWEASIRNLLSLAGGNQTNQYATGRCLHGNLTCELKFLNVVENYSNQPLWG